MKRRARPDGQFDVLDDKGEVVLTGSRETVDRLLNDPLSKFLLFKKRSEMPPSPDPNLPPCGHRSVLGNQDNAYLAVCMKSRAHDGGHGVYFGTDKDGEALLMEWNHDGVVQFMLVPPPPKMELRPITSAPLGWLQ